jgi:hypothetical protein
VYNIEIACRSDLAGKIDTAIKEVNEVMQAMMRSGAVFSRIIEVYKL